TVLIDTPARLATSSIRTTATPTVGECDGQSPRSAVRVNASLDVDAPSTGTRTGCHEHVGTPSLNTEFRRRTGSARHLDGPIVSVRQRVELQRHPIGPRVLGSASLGTERHHGSLAHVDRERIEAVLLAAPGSA